MGKNKQRFRGIQRCMRINDHNTSYSEKDIRRQHAHTHSRQARHGLYSASLSLSSAGAEHSEKQQEAEKHVMQEGAYCAVEGTDGNSHKPLGPSFCCLSQKNNTDAQTATLALLTHNAPSLLLHALRHSYRDVRGFMGNLPGKRSVMCD